MYSSICVVPSELYLLNHILWYVRVLINLWLFLFPIFLFAAQPKEFFLDELKKLEQRSHKYVELRGEYVESIHFFSHVACCFLYKAKDLSAPLVLSKKATVSRAKNEYICLFFTYETWTLVSRCYCWYKRCNIQRLADCESTNCILLNLHVNVLAWPQLFFSTLKSVCQLIGCKHTWQAYTPTVRCHILQICAVWVTRTRINHVMWQYG
jgi:hypothetical protein